MAESINTLLVDDEPLALAYLASLLTKESDIHIVKQCRNGREALEALRESDVDLVFMDVQMPGMTGLEVCMEVQADTMPMVVFATAYDEFALAAFELNAVDYLLKPIDPERVARAVSRCRERYLTQTLLGEKSHLVGALQQIRGVYKSTPSHNLSLEHNKLPIKDGGQTFLVAYDDIDWIDAAGDYMCVHAAGKTHVLRSTMKELEQRLPSHLVRIHRSTLVNIRKIVSIEVLPKGENALSLSCGHRLKVSRSYASAVRPFLR